MKQILRNCHMDLQYYPTPQKMIREILENISGFLYEVEEINFLEPAAGDGAICREVKKVVEEHNKKINIDCIEIEPVLSNALKGQGFNVVDTDFLNFESVPIYNLIVMNPPFNKGTEFILKAYNMLASNGKLVCILNAESIENPYTKERKQLINLLNRQGEYTILDGAFSDAERKTDVKTAIVVLNKANYENEFNIFGDIKPEVLTEEEKFKQELKSKVESSELVQYNEIEQAISIYRNCVKEVFEGISTIKKIKNSLKYLESEAEKFNIKPEEFINIILNNDEESAKEETIKKIRKMVWSYVLGFCDMDTYLYTNDRNDFYNKLDKGSATLSFTKENILQFFNNIFRQRKEYFKKGVIDLFEKITSYHSGNPYHREGWKTNRNWKINKKIIVNWGISFEDKYTTDKSGKFSIGWGNMDWLNDLDRVVRKIDGNSTNHGFIKEVLSDKFHNMGYIKPGDRFDNTCVTQYFNLKFYKKGSLHIEFKDDKILDELNLIGAKLRTDLGYETFGKTDK